MLFFEVSHLPSWLDLEETDTSQQGYVAFQLCGSSTEAVKTIEVDFPFLHASVGDVELKTWKLDALTQALPFVDHATQARLKTKTDVLTHSLNVYASKALTPKHQSAVCNKSFTLSNGHLVMVCPQGRTQVVLVSSQGQTPAEKIDFVIEKDVVPCDMTRSQISLFKERLPLEWTCEVWDWKSNELRSTIHLDSHDKVIPFGFQFMGTHTIVGVTNGDTLCAWNTKDGSLLVKTRMPLWHAYVPLRSAISNRLQSIVAISSHIEHTCCFLLSNGVVGLWDDAKNEVTFCHDACLNKGHAYSFEFIQAMPYFVDVLGDTHAVFCDDHGVYLVDL